MFLLKSFALLFVAFMVICWIRPLYRQLFQEVPAAIVKSAYAFMTLLGLILALNIMYLKELEGSIQQYLEPIFQDGVRSGRVSLVLGAVFISLCFVVANLCRSYYNLHRIEDEQERSVLRSLVSSLTTGKRSLDWLLRALMFLAIVFLIKTVANLNSLIPTSGSLAKHDVERFRTQFDNFWLLALLYYVLLLTWDLVMWLGNRARGTHADSAAVSQVLWLQALPVHFCGLVVSVMMCLPRRHEQLAWHVDLFSEVAFLAALVGCVFLIVSASIESSGFLNALLFWRRRDTPSPVQNPNAQSAESEA